MNAARAIALALMLFGLVLHTFTSTVKSTEFTVWFWLLSLSPYIVAACLYFLVHRPHAAAGALVLPAILDAGAYYSAFINPQSSTASLGLLFIPIWNVLLFAPLGAVIGWLIGRRARCDRMGCRHRNIEHL